MRRRRGRDVDSPWRDESRRRRGRDVDVSVETSRSDRQVRRHPINHRHGRIREASLLVAASPFLLRESVRGPELRGDADALRSVTCQRLRRGEFRTARAAPVPAPASTFISRRRRGRGADRPWTCRSDAAATVWIVATPWLQRGSSADRRTGVPRGTPRYPSAGTGGGLGPIAGILIVYAQYYRNNKTFAEAFGTFFYIVLAARKDAPRTRRVVVAKPAAYLRRSPRRRLDSPTGRGALFHRLLAHRLLVDPASQGRATDRGTRRRESVAPAESRLGVPCVPVHGLKKCLFTA